MSCRRPSVATYTRSALRTTASRHAFRSSMCFARMNAVGSTQVFSDAGRTRSGGAPVPRPAPYQIGAVTAAPNTASPTRILPVSCMARLRGGRLGRRRVGAHRLLAEVELALLLALHHERVPDELGDPGDLHARRPVPAHRRERGAVDGAHRRELVHAVLLLDVADGVPARHPAPQAHLHVLLGAEARAAAAAEGLLADRVLRHLVEVVNHVLQD